MNNNTPIVPDDRAVVPNGSRFDNLTQMSVAERAERTEDLSNVSDADLEAVAEGLPNGDVGQTHVRVEQAKRDEKALEEMVGNF